MATLACFKFQETCFKHCQILRGRISLYIVYYRLKTSVDQKLDRILYLQKIIIKKETEA